MQPKNVLFSFFLRPIVWIINVVVVEKKGTTKIEKREQNYCSFYIPFANVTTDRERFIFFCFFLFLQCLALTGDLVFNCLSAYVNIYFIQFAFFIEDVLF